MRTKEDALARVAEIKDLIDDEISSVLEVTDWKDLRDVDWTFSQIDAIESAIDDVIHVIKEEEMERPDPDDPLSLTQILDAVNDHREALGREKFWLGMAPFTEETIEEARLLLKSVETAAETGNDFWD